MVKECKKCPKPQLDETALDCEDYTPEGCIILDKYPYLEIEEGDRLSNLITKLISRFKAIAQALGRRVDYHSLYVNGDIYLDDADASANGIEKGRPYIDTNGILRVRLN